MQQFKSAPSFQPPGTNFTKEQTEQIRRVVKSYLAGGLFSARKLADTPTDSNSVVPRGYVTANGSVAGRPPSSVAAVGQFYLNTQSNQPMWYTTAGWVNGVGSVVAGNI